MAYDGFAECNSAPCHRDGALVPVQQIPKCHVLLTYNLLSERTPQSRVHTYKPSVRNAQPPSQHGTPELPFPLPLALSLSQPANPYRRRPHSAHSALLGQSSSRIHASRPRRTHAARRVMLLIPQAITPNIIRHPRTRRRVSPRSLLIPPTPHTDAPQHRQSTPTASIHTRDPTPARPARQDQYACSPPWVARPPESWPRLVIRASEGDDAARLSTHACRPYAR